MSNVPFPINGAAPFSGPLPVVSQDDVNAVMPSFLRPDDPMAVRDAIFSALTQILLTYQQRATYGAASADVLRARGTYLSIACADHGVKRQMGEDDDTLLARFLTQPLLVTPAAILAAVGSIIAPFTTVLPRYSERDDRWILRKRANGPMGYLYKRASIPQSPDDLTRGYPSEVSHTGFAIPQREPGAARIYNDAIGRFFLIRIPTLAQVGAITVNPLYQNPVGSPARAFYLSQGLSNTNTTFLRNQSATATALYSSIISAVERIKGASIRWMLQADPKLVS